MTPGAHQKPTFARAWQRMLAAALVALVLHLLFGLVAKRAPEVKRKPPVTMEIVDTRRGSQGADVAKLAPKTPPPEPKRDGQVVALPPPDVEETPKDADYLAEHDHRAERETKSRDRPRTPDEAIAARRQRTQVTPPQPASAPAGGDARPNGSSAGAALQPFRLQLGQGGFSTARPAPSATLPAPGGAGLGGALAEAFARSEMGDAAVPGRGEAQQGEGTGLPTLAQLTPSAAQLAKLTGAPSSDDLPNVETDADTRLNAWQYKYASFFNRIHDAVEREWRGAAVMRRADPDGRLFGQEDRITVVLVTLDRQGNIVSVTVDRSSDVVAYDDEARRAFVAAGPFLNPPAGLFGDRTQMTFSFGFHLDFTRNTFDLNWR